MNKEDSDSTDSAGRTETTPSNNVIHEQHEVGHDRNQQHQHPDHKFYDAIKRLWQWTTEGWKNTKFHQRVELGLAGLVTFATIAYVIVAFCTLREIRRSSIDTHSLAKSAFYQWSASNRAAKTTDEATWGGQGRPWIKIGDEVRLDTQKMEVSTTIKNYGLVPARRIIPSYFLRIGIDVPQTWNNKPCSDAMQKSSRLINDSPIVFPNAEISLVRRVDAIDRDFMSATSQDRWLVMCVAYQDNYIADESGPVDKIDPNSEFKAGKGRLHTTEALYFWDGKRLNLKSADVY